MTDAADNPELLSLRYVDIDTLSAWDRNAKKHDFGALVESIVRHGFRDPPAYDSALNAGAGGVAEGNGRADALRMMRAQQMQPPRGILLQDGRWFAPVLFGVDSASQAAAEAYAVAHNNLTMAGGDFTDLDMSKMWDSVGYADLLADLARQGESPVTIDESALDALLAALAPLPEIGQGGDAFDTTPDDGPTRTALGELWLIGGVHRLLVGDCTDAANVARLMDGERADCVFTSPPYAVGVDYGETYQDTIDNLRAMLPKLAHLWRDVVTPGGFVVLNFGDVAPARDIAKVDEVCEYPMAVEYWPVFRAEGWFLHSRRIWCKPNARVNSMWCIGSNRAATDWEHLWTWRNPGDAIVKRVDGEMRSALGWIDTSLMHGVDVGKEVHGAGMALGIVEWMLNIHSRPNAIVLEPFCGTGTTIIGGHRLGRRVYATEISPRFADVILKRAEAENLVCELISE